MVKRPAPAVVWVRLVLAALATALCEASGLALTATAAWLICRAFEQPPLAALSLAVVAVRALAIVRGTLRYGERLAARRSAVRAAYFSSASFLTWPPICCRAEVCQRSWADTLSQFSAASSCFRLSFLSGVKLPR